MKKIKITVDRDGNATVEAFGFKGRSCLAATKAIEDALGKVKSRKEKPEMAEAGETKVASGQA